MWFPDGSCPVTHLSSPAAEGPRSSPDFSMIPSRHRCHWGRALSMALFLARSRPWVAPGGVHGPLVLPLSLVASLQLSLPGASLIWGLVRRLAFPVGSLPWLLLLLAAPCLGLLLLESLTFLWSCSLPIGRTSRRGVRGLWGCSFQYVVRGFPFGSTLPGGFHDWRWFRDSAAPLSRILSPGFGGGRGVFLAPRGLAPFAPGLLPVALPLLRPS